MKKLTLLISMLLIASASLLAQRTVVGKVTDSAGSPLPGATVLVKGTSEGTAADDNGNFRLNVPANANTLVVSYTGFNTQEVLLGASNVVNVALQEGVTLSETVVTALGITKKKNELPYSAQTVGGDDVSKSRDGNVVNALSGKVAGLNIKRNNSLGGSTNIVLRGTKSLTGNNQALFVVDGVPVDNSNTNTSDQLTGRQGYDFGNAAADINSDDIDNITVLKGAAASALYGSRAANGVIVITTKKGSKAKGLGVTLNSGLNVGTIEKSTFATYQKKYGAGYGAYYEDPSGFFLYRDIDGDGTDDLVTPLTEDASWGAKFDPNLKVFQWDAFDPTSPNYKKATPWVAAANDPSTFFETAIGTNNGVMIDGSNDKGYFKLGYNHITDKGILPNSNINKDMINFGGSYNLTRKLTAYSAINYTGISAKGRYGTGYGDRNLMTNFRQWWQTNVDISELRQAYDRTKQNVTWNWADPTILAPIYWDNPYWTRYENYETDGRGRYFGNVGLEYKLLSWLNLKGQMSLDRYSEYQEERIAVGSVDVPKYSRYDRTFQEINYDLLLSSTPLRLAESLHFNFLLGSNVRKNEIYAIADGTNGGLAIPGIYALSNSVSARNAPDESLTKLQVNGLFAQTSFNWDNSVFLDLSVRRDKSSALPKDNNVYIYPAASLGLLFSNWTGTGSVFSFGKLRFNYAQVGNTPPPLVVDDVYNIGVATLLDRGVYATSFGSAPLASVSSTKNNPGLKPESTKSFEVGIETRFFEDRLGLDLTYYNMSTVDQIFRAPVSRTTGYSFKYINAGEISNKGVELQLFVRPVATRNFDWRMDVNWAKNTSLVVDLGGIDNLQLASLQGGVSINATKGEPYGTIRGSNFVYKDGQKVVNSLGRYVTSPTSNQVIGNINPDWTGGVTNSFRFKNVNLSFLVDVKQGGQVWSLDMSYGLATGLYPETAGLNDKGNEVRLPTADGGGILLPGVKADGTPNTTYASGYDFGIYGYRRNPNAAFVYDASFVKLREVNLSYDFPKSWLGAQGFLKGVNVGIYARNLWTIHKNTPYSDPEEGFSSGNIQGYQGGAYPNVRVIGFNLGVKF
ncbi:MAG TPA: SusC/RagA family TonB-linked outer membrane protein [Saprospiraceae bacterium]|nr:SusC/RagA family TonB-linked outer membrane protein [Saprospiraceae bacterium]HNM58463.1 SusC/RagA family TonB-linked outer membrane protein [Saprospiraceae bacterium]